ncbi:uncharacterized protein LAJ45_07512 [Morchella importuna]|uniref:uncharacterized protein n=1 Tax=Morchella importuna TaxID=1174673 RepID=UPI001E8CF90A|nr:uncharacterized protein LAJ45_07512 [Morchella importuna]KAH8148410.1 hypothetical protein LAJ45_07512 [Morchella importuna]
MEPNTSTYILSRSTLPETLDDLCVRFILNIPEEELNSIERLSFQIEAAQWYYEDFLRDINPALPTLNLRNFISKIFAVLPLPVIAGLPAGGAESAFINFMSYKTRVPVRGAIILNPTMDKLLLVKGYKKGASWSYPRGKINKDEDDMVCAIREVFEETGFDCEGLAKEEDYVEIVMRDQNLRLYIVPGVSEETVFECQTRKEISDIKWHRLTDLPAYSKKKNGPPPQNEVRTGKYYMVAPFLKDLRKWISTKGKKWLQEQHQQSLAAAANRIADETEVEEETATPMPDPSAQLRNFIGIPPPPQNDAAMANGYSSTDEASMRLKNMFFGSSSNQQEGQQVHQSARLMNMLGAGPSPNQQSGVSLNVEQLEPNPLALLSILKNGSGEPVTPRVPPQGSGQRLASPQRATPAVQNYVNSPQSQKSTPIKKALSSANSGIIGSNTGWPEFPRNVPDSTTQLPSSPPPMSNHPSARYNQNYQNQPSYQNQPGHQGQPGFQSQPSYQNHQNYQSHQNHQNHQSHQNHQAQHHVRVNYALPPQPQPYAFSPVNQNGYRPPMVPTPAVETNIPLPSIPGEQAGTLLSILTGATPAPQQPPAQAPPPLAPRAAASPKVEVRASPAAPYEQPVARPQATPRTPKLAHTAQQAALLATLRGDSPRAASVASGQAFAPPPQVIHAPISRSSTVGPQAQHRASPGVIRQTSQYAPPPSNVDRRDSFSSQQQTLLAMFTGGVSPAPESALPNPEQAYSNPNPNPNPASGGRSRSASRGRVARKEKSEPLKSPLGNERQGLMAYLEGVAKMGGQ